MNIKLNRGEFLEKLSLCTRFTSTKFTSLPALQGMYFKAEKNKIHLYSSNLNSFFHTFLGVESEKEESFVIEPKKLIEFISFLREGKIELQTREKQLIITSGKTKGRFPTLAVEDFPLPPKIEEKGQKLKTGFLVKNIPLVLFSSAKDETRPALSGVNFLTNEELVMVATDGFRLSIIKTKKEKALPSVIMPAEFLREVLHSVSEEKEADFFYSAKEKIILFKLGEDEFYSRLIEGDFPPFEKVIPQEKRTTIRIEKEEFLRNIKLISVFARDFSNIVLLEAEKDGIRFRPKTDTEGDNSAFQDAEIEGEEQTVAFNFKFLLDLLNTISAKRVIIEILRPDAPVVFKVEGNEEFLHIIMPVRIQE